MALGSTPSGCPFGAGDRSITNYVWTLAKKRHSLLAVTGVLEAHGTNDFGLLLQKAGKAWIAALERSPWAGAARSDFDAVVNFWKR